jgi:hypothetical protein
MTEQNSKKNLKDAFTDVTELPKEATEIANILATSILTLKGRK